MGVVGDLVVVLVAVVVVVWCIRVCVHLRNCVNDSNPKSNSNPTSLTLTAALFKPQSNAELQSAVNQCAAQEHEPSVGLHG